MKGKVNGVGLNAPDNTEFHVLYQLDALCQPNKCIITLQPQLNSANLPVLSHFAARAICYYKLMSKKYIISIEEGESYPFDGAKENFAAVVVRVKPVLPQNQHFREAYQKLHRIIKVQSPFLVQILKVNEIRGKNFIIDFEYVPESLKKSQKIYETSFLTAVREKLLHFLNQLVQHRIKAEIKIENIGLTQEGDPKVFLGLNFEVVPESQQKALSQEYQVTVERMLELNFGFRNSLQTHSDTQVSDYSNRLDKKLIEMEGKLNKLKLKNQHSSQESSSSSCPKKSKEQNIVLQSISSRESNSSFTSGTTSYSLIGNQLIKPKIHKSSFGDYSTTSYRLNQQSIREDSLKKRVTNALEKTQQAFKIYEKYTKRKHR